MWHLLNLSPRGTRVERSGSGCANRGCAQSRSGCPTSAHLSSGKRPTGSPSQSPAADRIRRTRISLTRSPTGTVNEARRDLDGGRCWRLRWETAARCYSARQSVRRYRVVTICAFTTNQTDAPLLRIPVDPNDRNGLRQRCRLMADKITTVSKKKLRSRVGRLDDVDMVRVNRAILVFLGLAGTSKGD